MAFTTNGNMHRHMRTHGQEQQQAIGYISSTQFDEDGQPIRSKKKRKQKSLPSNLNNSTNSPNANTQSQNSSFGLDDLSLKEGFLALLQLQNRGAYNDFNFDTFPQLKDNNDFSQSDAAADDEVNKLAFKRSLTQNSTLYNTLLNNSLAAAVNGNSSSNNKNDLADISSILSVISNVTPMLANVTAGLPQLPLNDEQMAKFSQMHQQSVQDQNKFLNNITTSLSAANNTIKNSKRSRNSQLNGSNRNLASSGKRVKRETKDSNIIDNQFDNEFNNLNSLTNLNNLKNSINSLNSINNLMNMEEDDQASEKSVRNGSDIENEMINGKKSIKQSSELDKSTAKLTTSQLLKPNNNLDDEMIEDDDNYSNKDLSNNDLSEEEEANKLGKLIVFCF